MVLVLKKLGEKSMSVEWVKEMITEGEGKKRMELDEKVNVLVAELERERKKC